MVEIIMNADDANLKESYKWWNSQIEKCTDLYASPKIVSAKIAFSIFYQICPQMMILDEFIDNDQAYWGEIRRFLASRFENILIADPSENFPQFINSLYNLKDKITLTSVNESLKFLQFYQTAEPSFFILRQLPLIVSKPEIYYETILSLPKYNSFMWTNIIKEFRFVENFYFMNKSCLTFFPKHSDVKDWNILLLCSAAFSRIFSESLEYSNKVSTYCFYYLKDITGFLEVAPDDVVACLMRDIFLIFKSTHKKIALREKNQTRAKLILLNLIHGGSEHAKMFIIFLLSFQPSILSKEEIIEIFTMMPIANISFFDFIELVCDENTCKNLLMYLYQQIIYSKVFHRSCASMILTILERYKNIESIRDDAIKFVYGLLIFLNFAKKSKKYKFRSMLICETLARFLDFDFSWLHDKLLSAASTIARLGSVPGYFDLFFPVNYKTNPDFSSLFSSIKSKNFQLKFFPFVKSKKGYALFETVQPANMEFKKQIGDTVTKLKSMRTKANSNDLVLQIGQEMRNIFIYLMKTSVLFPQDFQTLLLTILKNHTRITIINAYQLVYVIQLLFEQRSPATIYKIIEILRFGLESKNLISLYEYGVISKSYGKRTPQISIIALDKLFEIGLNSVLAIQTLRRIIKSSSMQNEIVSSIIISLLGSDKDDIKIEAIKTFPYIMNQEVDLTSIYKYLKEDLISANKDIQYFASKSLAHAIYLSTMNDPSSSQAIFSRLIKKENRIGAFSLVYQIYLNHFQINEVVTNIDEWALFLFLLAIDESYSINHLSIISKIVIDSHVRILGSNLNFLEHFIRTFCEDDSINFDEMSDYCLVIVLNSFLFARSSFKFISRNKELFYNALKHESKEIRLLSAQCFEKVAKLKPELSLRFIKELLIKQQNENSYYQAISLMLKHTNELIDNEIKELIISNKSDLNILQLSFLSNHQLNQDYLQSIDTKSNKFKTYLAFYLYKHSQTIDTITIKEIIQSFLVDISSKSNVVIELIYKIVLNCNLTDFYECLVNSSVTILQKNLDLIDLNEDEFDRRFLFNINQSVYQINENSNYKFGELLTEENLFCTIIFSYQTMVFSLSKETQQKIINDLFSNLNDTTIISLILLNEIICKQSMYLLPTDGLSLLLTVNRTNQTIKYISMCLSKWVSLFPDSIDACYASFIDSDPKMFSAFTKFYAPFINEKQIEHFMIHLVIFLNSNPLNVLDSIPYFVQNKNVTREMKKKISAILEEMLSYDFILQPKALQSMYHSIIALNPTNINKFAISLFHSPMNSSISKFYSVKLIQKVVNNQGFHLILDDLIKNSSLFKHQLLYELLSIRNSIENVPLMLILYHQTNDERFKQLIQKSFESNYDVSMWISWCSSLLIHDIMPSYSTKYDNSTRPSIKVKNLMASITKLLIYKIREMHPFNFNQIECILHISFELLKHQKWKRKAVSILSCIINSFKDTDELLFIYQQIQKHEEEIFILFDNASSFGQYKQIFFSLFGLYLKLDNPNTTVLIEKVTKILNDTSLVLYLRTISLLAKFIALPDNFVDKVDQFFQLIFEKQLKISDLKTELPLFIHLLNSNEKLMKTPIRIIQVLIIDQIAYKYHDYLLESLGILIDNENCLLSLDEIQRIFYYIKSNESQAGPGLELFLTNLAKAVPSNVNLKWQAIWQSAVSFCILKQNSIYFACLAFIFNNHLSQKSIVKCAPPVFHIIISSNYDDDQIVALSCLIFNKIPVQYMDSFINEIIDSAHRIDLIQRLLRIAFIRSSDYSLLNEKMASFLQLHFDDLGFSFICQLLVDDKTSKQGVIIVHHLLLFICSHLNDQISIEIKHLNFFDLLLIKGKQFLKKSEMERFYYEILNVLLMSYQILSDESHPLAAMILQKIPSNVICLYWKKLDVEVKHQIMENVKTFPEIKKLIDINVIQDS